ncbi:uncharacterized protein C2orf81 homolog [Rhynchocyon petersi]
MAHEGSVRFSATGGVLEPGADFKGVAGTGADSARPGAFAFADPEPYVHILLSVGRRLRCTALAPSSGGSCSACATIMIIYPDLISHDETFSSIYKIWEIVDRLCLEVEGKMRQERQTRDRGATRSKAEKARPPTVPVPQVEIVPGRLNESEWMALTAVEEGEDVVGDILADLLARVMDAAFQVYLSQQCVPFTISQACEAMLQIIEWRFLVRDEGETAVAEDPTWDEDEEPVACTTDSWAQGSVPTLHVNPVVGLEEASLKEVRAACPSAAPGTLSLLCALVPPHPGSPAFSAHPALAQDPRGSGSGPAGACSPGRGSQEQTESSLSEAGPQGPCEDSEDWERGFLSSTTNSLVTSCQDFPAASPQASTHKPQPAGPERRSSQLEEAEDQAQPKQFVATYWDPQGTQLSFHWADAQFWLGSSVLRGRRLALSRGEDVRMVALMHRMHRKRPPRRRVRPQAEVLLSTSELYPLSSWRRVTAQATPPEPTAASDPRAPIACPGRLRLEFRSLPAASPSFGSKPVHSPRLGFAHPALPRVAQGYGSQVWPNGWEGESELLTPKSAQDLLLQEEWDPPRWPHRPPVLLQDTTKAKWESILPNSLKLAPGVSLWGSTSSRVLVRSARLRRAEFHSPPAAQPPFRSDVPPPPGPWPSY